MKVQQEINSNIEYIGEIKENKVGIDRENIDFIATLLTSNLYSNPFESFLRETISNAYDSHIEANTDHPIILMIDFKGSYGFNYSKEPYNISVRDYGVGISPERFQQIYTNIGSSTKRESNDYIGGWGKIPENIFNFILPIKKIFCIFVKKLQRYEIFRRI